MNGMSRNEDRYRVEGETVTMNEILVDYLDELAKGERCVMGMARRILGDEGLRLVPRWMLGGDAGLMRVAGRRVILVAEDVRGPRRIFLVAHELAELAHDGFGIHGNVEARCDAIAELLMARCASCRHVRSLGIESPGSRPSDAA